MAKPRKQKAGEQQGKPVVPLGGAGAVRHQKLCLSIDMKRRMIYGHTEMEVLFPESGFVGLHAVNMTIKTISINGEPAEFEFFSDYESNKDEKQWSSVSCSRSAADAACSTYISYLEKELVPNLFISCGKTLNTISDQDNLANDGNHSQSTSRDKTIPNGHNDPALTQNVKLVRIGYQVDIVEGGIHFGSNLLFTDNQIRRARRWFPCMDSSLQFCCYDMEFTVDAHLVAVSNGDLLFQILSKDDPSRKTYVYKLNVPVSPCWISLIVAPFEILPDSHSDLLSYMSLPQHFSKLRNTVGFFHNAFIHYEDYLSSLFPFGSYTQVFIPPESSASPVSLGASMCIFGSNLLFDDKIIDETIQTRIKLAYALARQWFGVYIVGETPNDEWLVDGLAGFLTDSFVKRFFGINEARYRRYQANCTVCKVDVSGATALSSSAASKDLYGTQHLGLHGKVRAWKAVAILQMLEKQMSPESFRKILQIIIYRARDAARPLRRLSTKEFRHLANKVGNLERPFLKEFFPRWVASSGCPILWMGFSYNKRRNAIELAVVRDSTAPNSTLCAENISMESRESGVGWPGMMSIRVHELDGMYDHPSLPMTGETWQLLEIQCHSKLSTKRVQKPKKGTKPDGSDENIDTLPTLDTRTCMDSPLLWLRADPEMEYLSEIHFHQPSQMWVNQMEKDKDVVAQSQAITTLEALPQHSFSIVNALNGLLNDTKVFWRVRIEAAFALAHTASEDTDWAGLTYLIKFYKSRRFDEEIGLPRPNDFRDVPEYFVLKAIPQAIALVRSADNRSPREAVEFILQLLKYNDNSGNTFSDVYWLASLVQSISELEFGQQNVIFLSPLLKRVNRILLFDSLMPCHNGLLTISCIRTLTQIAIKMSASVSFDCIIKLIKSFRIDKKSQWKVQIEASRALLSLEFYWKGFDAALLLFIEFLDQETSLRGQVKLSAHAMRLCQVNVESESLKVTRHSTLLALLQLLTSRKSYNNVYLRHNLFCILQIIAGRSPSLYGMPHVQPQDMLENFMDTETGEQKMTSLKLLKPEEHDVDAQKPQEPPVGMQKFPEPPMDAPMLQEVPLDREEHRELTVDVEKPQSQNHPSDVKASSLEALPTSRAAKDGDTVSAGPERKHPVVKIRIKQAASSAKADGPDYFPGHSRGGHSEIELRPTSSMSVDAPVRSMGNEPTSTSNQHLEEVTSFHNRGSRMTTSVGSAKLLPGDDIVRELQCTADSNVVTLPEERGTIGPGISETYDHKNTFQSNITRDEVKPQTSVELNKSTKGETKTKKHKKDERKRKRDDKRGEGYLEDPEYLERKRLKKEKKRMEVLARLKSGEAKPSTSNMESLKKPVEPVEPSFSMVFKKPESTSEAKGGKGENSQATSGTKFRIKLKKPNGGPRPAV